MTTLITNSNMRFFYTLMFLSLGKAGVIDCVAADKEPAAGHDRFSRPNVLLIVSDDQGYGDFGFTGNKVVRTPNIDRLSEQSAFYPNLLVGPASTPTRSSLLTGRNYLDTGVWGVGSRGRVRRDEVMIPRFFTPSGYQTYVFGKMDGGINMMEMNASDRGFDYAYCPKGGTMPYQHKLAEGWRVELVTNDVIKQIHEAGDRPWLMMVAYIIPHLPWHCPDSYADVYRLQGYSEDLAQCYGSINQMDDQIGRLLAALREEGREENTIVMFMSDNGPVDATRNHEVIVWENSGQKQEHTVDWPIRNSNRLIGRKGEVWYNGIRSPLLVRWPGTIAPGIRRQPVGVEDILPTLLDLARIPKEKQPEHFPFAGHSFHSSLKDATAVDNREIFRLATGGPGTPKGHCDIIPDATNLSYSQLHTILQCGRYKFHHLPEDELRLYDIWDDPREINDLSGEMEKLTLDMAGRCRKQWDEIAKRNRTFPMRQILVNNGTGNRTAWKIQVSLAINVHGDIRPIDFGKYLVGFNNPGDSAEYEIEVQKNFLASLCVTGESLDKCGRLALLIDGEPVPVRKITSQSIEFKPIRLPSGKIHLCLRVSGNPGSESVPGKIEAIRIRSLD